MWSKGCWVAPIVTFHEIEQNFPISAFIRVEFLPTDEYSRMVELRMKDPLDIKQDLSIFDCTRMAFFRKLCHLSFIFLLSFLSIFGVQFSQKAFHDFKMVFNDGKLIFHGLKNLQYSLF